MRQPCKHRHNVSLSLSTHGTTIVHENHVLAHFLCLLQKKCGHRRAQIGCNLFRAAPRTSLGRKFRNGVGKLTTHLKKKNIGTSVASMSNWNSLHFLFARTRWEETLLLYTKKAKVDLSPTPASSWSSMTIWEYLMTKWIISSSLIDVITLQLK
jgi:hypothetical protein